MGGNGGGKLGSEVTTNRLMSSREGGGGLDTSRSRRTCAWRRDRAVRCLI